MKTQLMEQSERKLLSEFTPPSRRNKICNSFMNNLYAKKHKVNIISIRLEGGV
ncbi:MAG: hypothetical protein ABIA97_01600 [Candidatus Omnitrophota bacterium]